MRDGLQRQRFTVDWAQDGRSAELALGNAVYALVLLIVIRLWSAREERGELLRRRGLETDSARSPRSGNHAVALCPGAVVFVVFTSVIVLASLNLIIP